MIYTLSWYGRCRVFFYVAVQVGWYNVKIFPLEKMLVELLCSRCRKWGENLLGGVVKDVCRAYSMVMGSWVVFHRVVSEIEFFFVCVYATFPVDVELFLTLSASQPIETHIHAF